MAVHCTNWTFKAHIPPRETLGSHYYLPPLNYTNLNAVAKVMIMTSEDSTVITVRGDYDEFTALPIAGEVYSRNMTDGDLFEITATKPVQVMLEVDFGTLGISVVILPPVSQYSKQFLTPGFGATAIILESSDVDNTGTVTQGLTSIESVRALTYDIPTFSLTVFTDAGNYFILPGDSFYDDLNQILTWMVPLMKIVMKAKLTLPVSILLCDTNATTTSTTPTINVTSSTLPTPAPVQGTPSIPTDSPPTVVPFTTASPVISIATTTDHSGTTSAPVNTCFTECMCPCGWLSGPANYTAEELEEVIRKLTSAPDDRTSSAVIGSAGLAFLIVSLVLVLLLDVSTLAAHFRQLRDNLRQVFNRS
ncbi:hypothetical protein MAR_031868 [Mya arenaria]|uniref:IgGFc-binding protein N-terminal domain-containing protein n=1 Tax=Mya arenaria TaxID=6604 RepID=A0ABY7F7X9_MYAAR|nr:hypothetical protein MAR_031868 [Mya arenaria]